MSSEAVQEVLVSGDPLLWLPTLAERLALSGFRRVRLDPQALRLTCQAHHRGRRRVRRVRRLPTTRVLIEAKPAENGSCRLRISVSTTARTAAALSEAGEAQSETLERVRRLVQA